ncbi:65-kDa microtubule-associated protein 8 isoform X2 [Syzygium oleosum]|uniref:65-kDa microtubule-associated protein 8 isoform X2 n=1 Tax=Syzygium oleosum TaxID=219896 RepID=UPI0024BA30C2|nr:65-kDa microtubule-associated protein 8 isoform X2 [Syzygium oleosum]
MGSIQTPIGTRSSALLETSCGYLLQELQIIWDEVGEDQFTREKVLLDLEQECLEVYRRKVDSANISRTRLHQQLAEAESEVTHLLLSLGERSLPGRPEKMAGTLKEQLDSVTPALRDMQLRKEERLKQFRAVQGQIQKISAEIAGKSEFEDSSSNVIINESDLSLKKLEEYQNELQRLHTEKNDRLQRVDKYIDTIHKLSATLGMDSSMIITKVHPTLNELCGISKNISDTILEKLDSTVKSLEEEKQKRFEKLNHLAKALTNLWNLMDTPYEDRQLSSHVTYMISVTPAEVSGPGSLTLNIIQQAEAEVKRLDQLKASKMRELFLKKQNELEGICSRSHMEIPSRSEIDSILNLINSALLDMLIATTQSWEEERKKIFLYDEVPLLAMLEEYNALRQEKEAEKQKQKFLLLEKKKVQRLQTQVTVEQENSIGSRPGTSSRRMSNRSLNGSFGHFSPVNRRLSPSIQQSEPNSISPSTQGISFIKEGKKRPGQKMLSRPHLSSHFRDETASVVSTCSGPLSP